MSTRVSGLMVALAAAQFLVGCAATQHHDPTAPPQNATVIFDGTDFSHWVGVKGGPVKWELVDGAMKVVPGTGSIATRESYRDFRVHIEFNVPQLPPLTEGKGRGNRGNSGVYLQRRYEVQILDSYGVELKDWDCGALYRVKLPDSNASKPAGEWQSYDITFRAARYAGEGEACKKTENARVTVYHNGTLIHDNVELETKTGAGWPEGPQPGPILLQDHGNEVRFRNIWILPHDN